MVTQHLSTATLVEIGFKEHLNAKLAREKLQKKNVNAFPWVPASQSKLT